MSIGPSRARIQLAYVDDLLHDFQSTGPSSSKQFPRTIQQIFQRLLVVCGGGTRSVTSHAVQALLQALHFVKNDDPLPGPARILGEPQAGQILGLLVEYAVSEGGGQRSKVERKGGTYLFDALVNNLCDLFLTSSEKELHDLVADLLHRVLAYVNPEFQCVLLCCLGSSLDLDVVRKTAELHLAEYLTVFATKNTYKCEFRVDYIVRILHSCLTYEFRITSTLLRSFINRVISDNESHRSRVQPYLCLLFSKLTGENLNFGSTTSLKLQIDRFLLSGEIDSKEVRSAMAAPNYKMLSMAMQETGGICTTSPEAFANVLQRNGLNDPALIGPSTVANAIVMMVRTSATNPSPGPQTASVVASWDRAGSAALADSAFDPATPQQWNGHVFAKVMHVLNSSLNWTEVIMRLDQEGFVVRDRNSLILLTNVLVEAFGLNSAPFPVSMLYRDWQVHRMGHLSWLKQIAHHPDVFCLGDYPHNSVNLSSLKVQPEETNKDVGNWKCLNLLETLFKLGDLPALTQHVMGLMQVPMTSCPDVFVLGICQLQGSMVGMRQHLLQITVPTLLNGHSNTIGVLNAIWNAEGPARRNIRQVILTALVNLYLSGIDDLAKLTKVLEIGHELKPNGLAELFNIPNKFQFTIDLACLASKRDFLKLDKWLEDKFREHAEPFVLAVIGHLKRRLPIGVVPGAAGTVISQEVYHTLSAFLLKHQGISASVRAEHSVLVSQLRGLTMKNETGRSSSASSQGRVPLSVTGPGGPAGFGAGNGAGPPPPSGQGRFAPPTAGPPTELNLGGSLFGGGGTGGFGNGHFRAPDRPDALQALSNAGLPAPPQQGASGFMPNVTQMSMSPSSQMLRSAIPGVQPPAPQRQNSSTGGWPNIPAPGAMRSTPGATTPQGAIDFRPQLPPTNATSDIQQVTPRPPAAAAPFQGNEDMSHVQFTEEVQDEANTYFEQIYAPNGLLSVNEFLTKLKGFQQSPHQREREVLACVVKNLFEEYRFFHDYPDRELMTTAEVYGGIIRDGIITNLQFATAVRKVIESLQSEVNSKLWTFGLVALNACKKKLCCYPKVCAMIMQHDNFPKFPPTLKAYVSAGVSERLPPQSGRETPPSWQPSVVPSAGSPQRNNSGDGQRPPAPGLPSGRTGASVLSYTNVDTLVAATEKEGAEVEKPNEQITDKVSFLFNNLSQSNLQQKTDEMRALIKENGEKFVKWLAQYIVMKRVSIEQNFQPLYNNFVQAIDDPVLDKCIKAETFRNIKILLRSDKRQAASNYSDRQLLKNLGLWLGAITIARSRPITVGELDLKSLLMEAYYKGQQELLFVVPFIAKILTSCAKTNIFSPTSAWIRSILKILAELHNEPDLKINLKFEIEVLCKELSVSLSELPLDGVLKDTDRLLRLPQQLSDLKLLQQPDTGSSPVPSQMRLHPAPGTGASTPQDIGSLHAGTDTKPGTPLPGADAVVDSLETGPAPAHFAYHDINVVSFDGLVPHLKMPAHHPLFQLHPQLKHLIKPAINHAIKELIGPVTERALKVAMTVTEHVVKKDFALDGDDQKMKKAGHHMMRAMTAGMAAITCRDPLQTTLVTCLSQSFVGGLRGSSSQPDQKVIDDAALIVMSENLELATNFIVKTACEKATPELDKRLEAEFSLRQTMRREGKEFVGNQDVLAAQAVVPDRIRNRPGPISKEQMAVYEEFSTKICGFKPTAVDDMIPDFAGGAGKMALPGLNLDKNTGEYEKYLQTFMMMSNECDSIQSNVKYQGCSPKVLQAFVLLRDNLRQLACSMRDGVVLHNAIVHAIEQYLNAYTTSSTSDRDSELTTRLSEMTTGWFRLLLSKIPLPELATRITQIIISSQVEYRWNCEAIEILFRHCFISHEIYDRHLADVIEGGNYNAVVFAQRLIKMMSDRLRADLVREKLPLTVEQLQKLQQFGGAAASRPTPDTTAANSPSGLPDRAPGGIGGTPGLPTDLPQSDNGELQSKVEQILREWISLCYTPMAQRDPQQALATMIHMMHEHGVLATDDMITRFFRLCTEMCVDVSYRLLKDETATHANTVVRQRCYYTLDAFVKLTCLMVKHSDGSQHQTKINLLKKVLNIVTSVLLLDHEVRRADFHPMPYHRILVIMFNELTQPDTALEPIAWPILEAFGQALFILQPRRAPRFALAWLDIVGHRNVIARLLGSRPTAANDTVDPLKTSAMYTQLIICHLKFLAPFLRNIELPKSIAVLYKGTLRVLLVVLHDFPELLCEYHYVICDTIPPNCIQLRNLVLSAYPRQMRLPDPFALNFKQVDSITEMAVEPKMNLNMVSIIPGDLRQQLENYFSTRNSIELLSALPNMLQVSHTPGSKYNTTVLNAVVLYVGMRAIEAIHSRGQRISMTTIAHTAYMDIFQNLAVRLCTEGRYLLFNAIANQLRYPNAHTHYFSCTLLFLFQQADMNVMKEQITRILFERLVALRPHPWGLLITFIELIRNPQYQFWDHEFTKCAPEIERLFRNVAATCMQAAREQRPVEGTAGVALTPAAPSSAR